MTSIVRKLATAVLVASSTFASYGQRLPLPKHIVVLFEENYAYSQIIGSSSAPNINALCADTNAAVFTQFFAIEHPSEPNYLDIFSGGNQGITDDGLPASEEPSNYPFTTPNLCAELLAAGKTFKTYSENLPSVGYDGATYTTGSANYARKHNPCTNWVGTGANQYPDTVNQPFTAFPSNYSNLPTVSFVVPNMTNDMHDYTCSSLPCPESITLGDTWEHTNLDSLRKWSLANNTLYVIIYDEDDDYHNNNIPCIFYGPMVKGGIYSQNINHFNFLRTIEDIYGLGHAGAASDSSAIRFCWKESYITEGVASVSSNVNFRVMPNPASNEININCDNTSTSHFTVNISDESGRVTGTYSLVGNNIRVNTSDYPNGIYFYRIVNDNNNTVDQGKFVIAHN